MDIIWTNRDSVIVNYRIVLILCLMMKIYVMNVNVNNVTNNIT